MFCPSLSLNKVESFQPDTLLETTPARLFFWDFSYIFKSTFFVELLWVTASVTLEDVFSSSWTLKKQVLFQSGFY